MPHAQKNFLERLQSADEATKRRWTIGITAVVMLVVIYVWLAYFNNLVVGFSESQPGGGTDFLSALKGGTSFFSSEMANTLHALGNILSSPRDYIINPK